MTAEEMVELNEGRTPFLLAYRPDQQPTVKPSREDVADALIQARSSGMCHFGKVCNLCDCGLEGHTDDEARRADSLTLIDADAVLAMLPGRTEDEVKAEALAPFREIRARHQSPGLICTCDTCSAVWRADRIESEARS